MRRDIIALLLICLAAGISLFEFFNRELIALKVWPFIFFTVCLIAIGAIIKNFFKKPK